MLAVNRDIGQPSRCVWQDSRPGPPCRRRLCGRMAGRVPHAGGGCGARYGAGFHWRRNENALCGLTGMAPCEPNTLRRCALFQRKRLPAQPRFGAGSCAWLSACIGRHENMFMEGGLQHLFGSNCHVTQPLHKIS